MMPGVPERRARSYVRHGTTTLFAALDVASGVIIGKCYKRHPTVEFLKFLEEIDDQVPEGLDIHIVMDNYPTQSSVKNSEVLDLESRNGTPRQSNLPGIGFAEGDSLQM
jgi:hypothetical protein